MPRYTVFETEYIRVPGKPELDEAGKPLVLWRISFSPCAEVDAPDEASALAQARQLGSVPPVVKAQTAQFSPDKESLQ